jgi:V8-like Glu-specific endopeptidase
MRGTAKRSIGIALAVLWVSLPVSAEKMPQLPAPERALWTAVGVVNATGPGGRASCTGTLIAPDLVITAAHCAGNRTREHTGLHFVAGWSSDGHVAHATSLHVEVHPAYTLARGNARYAFDVAFVRLATPIPASVVAPIALHDGIPPPQGPLTLLGYDRKNPQAIMGRSDCQREPQVIAPLLTLGCPVVGGNSGGPVLLWQDNGWRLAAVIVARNAPGAEALAVPVNMWMRDIWKAARRKSP